MTATQPLDLSNLPPVLTSNEYGVVMRLTSDTVKVLCRAGRIKGATKIGGVWRIPRSAIPSEFLPEVPAENLTERTRRANAAANQLAAS